MPTIATTDTATLCAGTLAVQVSDNRALTVRTLQFNRSEANQSADECITQHRFTAAGHLLTSIDPRLFATHAVLPNFRYASSLSGRPLTTLSQDAGQQTTIHDNEGAVVWKKNGRRHIRRWTYDVLHRPLELRNEDGFGAAHISERFVYGEAEPEPVASNTRGQLVRHYDMAGLNEIPCFSTSGKALRSARRLLADPVALSDWAGDEPRWQTALEMASYESRSSYNALGMVERSTDAAGNVQRQVYDAAGQLAGSSLTLKGQATESILREITYSAAGKVLNEIAGNGVATRYAYEPQTQRLDTLRTTRTSQTGRPALLRDLRFTYDPVDNILSVSDVAVPTRFHDNQRVEATSTYTYDALYQLLGATGRESANGGQQTCALPRPIAMEGDPSLLGNYTRRYTYDRSGNLTHIRHQGQTAYTSEMLVSPTSNHAVLQIGNLSVTDVEGHFDACGNLRQLTPGQPLSWDERNQLRCVALVQRSGIDDDCETYQYDSGGIRIRKTTTSVTSGTTRTAEVLYLPGIEIRRTRSNVGVVEELHVITLAATGRQAVRVLHWATGKPDDIPNDQWRVSLDDQIGSSLMELDRNADILTLEAFYPYGGTAIWSGRNESETKYKFVRYSGKERDATGLYNFGARYYAPWQGRWLNPDPSGTIDGLHLYRMAKNNPISWADGNGRKPQPVPPPPPPLHMVGTHTPASRPLAPPVAAAWKSAPSKPPFAATRVTPPVAGYKQRSQDWRYEHYVEVGALKAEISMKYGAVKDIKIANSTMKEMNKKMGISFISDSIEENPIAWTNPEGKIMLATDHPDYSNAKGGLDASKIRSTIVHEAMHFSSSGKRGLQGQTDLNIQNLNIDEYVTDYFSRETYKSLYPEEEYKTAYFTRDLGGDPVIWGGNYVKFMVEHGSATLRDFEEAYFRDPSKYKEPEEEVVKQWQAIAKRTARSPKQ